MDSIESIELSKVLKLIPKPKYVLGTTYTLSLAFFESVVLPCIDRSRLKSCVILCDTFGYQNALTEASALQGAAQDYIVAPAPLAGAFHSKVWIIIGEGEAALLTGSGNLTQAGFMTNAELFDALHFMIDSPPSLKMAGSIRAFIRGLASMWSAQDSQHLLCTETLSQIETAFADLPVSQTSDESAHFIHTFTGPLIDQIPTLSGARDLYIAAPFFGGKTHGIDLLTARHPTAKLHLFPAVHDGTATDVPLDDVLKRYRKAAIAQLVVPNKKKAFAHLKLYGAAKDKDTAWLLCTSANCTKAAWQGDNVEAGLLRNVSQSVLSNYFTAGTAPLPTTALEIDYRNDVGPQHLPCWVTDTGGGVDIAVAHASRHRLPLHNVTLTIRAGSSLATCDRATLFHESSHVHLPWTVFPSWKRPRKTTHCFELRGTDASGAAVHSICLVENRLLLSADPIHRSAFRGALALLDAEGTPEWADVAALFTLANDVFEGSLLKIPEVDPGSQTAKNKVEEENAPVSIAVWPPQADPLELRKRIGSIGQGHLLWFQKIFKTFLNNEPSADKEEPAFAPAPDEEDEAEQRGIAENLREPRRNDTEKVARRIWEPAFDNYMRLRDKLRSLCPTRKNAPDIWPAAIFALLSTLAVYRTAKRLAPDMVFEMKAEMLCDDFFRSMFSQRAQGEDYCRPGNFRYRSNKFPPLAEDLYCEFGLRPHIDLATVLLALILNQRVRDPSLSSPVWRKSQKYYLSSIYDPLCVPGPDILEACRILWRKYMCGDPGKITDTVFETEFSAVLDLLNEKTP